MKKYFLYTLMFALCITSNVFAQEQGDVVQVLPVDTGIEDIVDDGEEVELEILADVNVIDSYIVEQNDHNLAIEFVLQNGIGVQSDVRYAVQLVKAVSDEDYVLTYQKVYDDVLVLDENSEIHKNLSLDLPSFIDGEYDVWIIAENSDGLPIGNTMIDTIMLYGNQKQSIAINEESCHLFVDGEAGDYAMMQGVDVALDEQIILACSVTSYFQEPVSVNARFNTFKRTVFGDKVKTGNNTQSITLEPQVETDIKITIPKAQDPQSYSIKMNLSDESGKELSNAVYAHYVVQGASASISSVQLNKREYDKGEKINVSFLWSLSADNFPESRGGGSDVGTVYYNLTIKDNSGKNCINQIKKETLSEENTGFEKISKDSIAKCVNPTVLVSIEDREGNVLVSNNISFKTSSADDGSDIKEEQIQSVMTTKNIAWIVIGMITLIAFITIFLRRNKGMQVLLLIFLSSGFFIAQDSFALTVKARESGGSYAVCNFGLNKTTVSPGTSIKGTATGCKIVSCWNEMYGYAYINNSLVKSRHVVDGVGGNRTYTYWFNSGSGVKYINAGSQCKRYSVPVKVVFNHLSSSWHTSYGYGSLYYNVVGCNTVDGTLNATVAGCSDGVTLANVNLSVTNVRATGAGTRYFRYKCGSAGWTGWTTRSTYTCKFGPGTKTVYAQLKFGSAVSAVKSKSVRIDRCPFCGDGVINRSGEDCDNGSRNGAVCSTAYDNTCTYCGTDCLVKTKRGPYCGDGIKNGTEQCDGTEGVPANANCSAECKIAYEATCGTQHPDKTTDTTPPSGSYTLCGTNCSVIATPTLDTDGKWKWKCEHNQTAQPQTVDCEAPSCLSGTPVDFQRYVYFESSGQPQNASVTVTCPGVCCKIKGTRAPSDVIICSDTVDGYIEVQPGSQTYPTECWFDEDDNGDDDGEPKVDITDITVNTMCTVRECNAQGTCQGTPQAANAPNQCSSTCNSNADCSSGRIIETRP